MNLDKIACWTGIGGAILMALHISLSPWAYVFWIISSVCWMEYGMKADNPQLVIMNAFFSMLNLLGIIRWLL